MEQIYKFLKENNIEDIQVLIDYKLGKKELHNPYNIEIDIECSSKNSSINIIIKEGNETIVLDSNSTLYAFIMNNMPKKDLGKYLLPIYIDYNNIYSIEDFIFSIYDDDCLPANTVNAIREDLYLCIEWGKRLEVKKVYFKYENKKEDIIEINLEDFYDVISKLSED